MSRAILVYVDNDNQKTITLESGSLFYIDERTKKYESLKALTNSHIYNEKIKSVSDNNNGKVKLYCVKDSSTKEELPVLINDVADIQIYNDIYTNKQSDAEKSRKLLFNSKNKRFIKKVMNNEILRNTLNFSVNISYEEYLFSIKKGLNPYKNNEDYYIRTIDLFKYVSNNKKYGLLREAFEDSLDLWKNRLMSLDTDTLYYYLRTLRILQNDYYNNINKDFSIKNLNLRTNNIIPFLLNGIDSKVNSMENIKIKKIA